MKTQKAQKHTWTIGCTGIVVTILWVIVIFWIRSIPQTIAQAYVRQTVELRPTGLFPDELEKNEPVSRRRSRLESGLNGLSPTTALGFWDRDSHERLFNTNTESKTRRYYGTDRTGREQLVFDRERGVWTLVFLTCDKDEERSWTKTVASYAGPKGMSLQSAANLGRFQLGRSVSYYPYTGREVVFYDGQLRQLFRLDFNTGTVTAGTILPEGESVVQMGPALQKNPELIGGLRLTRPQKLISPEEVNDYDPKDVLVEPQDRDGNLGSFAWLGGDVRVGATHGQHLVLTSAGEIYKIDPQTAQLETAIDRLPKLGSGDTINELLAYTVLPVSIDHDFAGIVVAAASRDTKRFHLRATAQGKETIVATNRTFHPENRLLLSPFLMMRAAEGLHPLGLSVLSRWLAPRVEALAGYRALFIVPNSGAIQAYLDPHNDALAKQIGFFLGVVPQLILGLLIGSWLRRETRNRGLKPSVCKGWLLAGIILGVPAYITYQLTRLRLPLITCNNCGQGRRADQDHCHHCKSSWENTGDQVPTWRVLEST